MIFSSWAALPFCSQKLVFKTQFTQQSSSRWCSKSELSMQAKMSVFRKTLQLISQKTWSRAHLRRVVSRHALVVTSALQNHCGAFQKVRSSSKKLKHEATSEKLSTTRGFLRAIYDYYAALSTAAERNEPLCIETGAALIHGRK